MNAIEQIKAEIERYKHKADTRLLQLKKRTLLEEAKDIALQNLCGNLLHFINSLQQEQPKLPGYDKALLEVKSKVDKLYDEAGIGTCEYDSGFYNGIIETCMKLRGFIKARTSKEQSKVDLEKEIEKYFSKWVQGASDEGCCNADSQLVSIYDCHRIARHFYELGRNARRED